MRARELYEHRWKQKDIVAPLGITEEGRTYAQINDIKDFSILQDDGIINLPSQLNILVGFINSVSNSVFVAARGHNNFLYLNQGTVGQSLE